MIVLFNKPYGILCQFTDRDGRPTLADFISLPGVYPAGRLDLDSEGLLLLTDDGRLIKRLTDPAQHTAKTYLAQVDGLATTEQVQRLRTGLRLNDGPTRPAAVDVLADAPGFLWPRQPPVRFRAHLPTCWLRITISEGRNRQVRRMTAAVGLPTLRLIRQSIGAYALDGLAPGQFREVEPAS